MARKPRIKSGADIYYIFSEPAAGIKLFKDEEDFLCFFSALKKSSSKHFCTVYAYSVQNNGIYFLIKEEDGGSVSAFMQGLFSSYALKYNNRYLRSGAVTNGRYKSIPVENFNEALELSVYINNLSGISSHKAYLNLEGDEFCDVTYIKKELENLFKDKAVSAYKDLLNKNAAPQKEFKKRKKLSEEQIFTLSKKILGFSVSDIAKKDKKSRNLALKKLYEKGGFTVAQISRTTKLSRGIVSRAILKSEDISNTHSLFKTTAAKVPVPKTAEKEDIWLL